MPFRAQGGSSMSLLKRIEGAGATPPGGAMVPSTPSAPQGQSGGIGNSLTQAGGAGTGGLNPPGSPGSGGVPARSARQGLDSIAALRKQPGAEQDNFAELRSRVQQKLIQKIG